MKTLAFLSQKGGSGKTTLAVHTAVAAYEAGAKVVIIDTDPQQSATVWSDARQVDAPVVATVAAAELQRVLDAARSDGMTLAIVDAAPHAAPDAAKVAQAADLIAIPVRPTAFDLAAAQSMVSIVRASGSRAIFVLSACPFRAPEISETQQVLASYGLPVAPVEITDRRAFARAIASGRAVTEFDGSGKAAFEIRELWAWLSDQLAL